MIRGDSQILPSDSLDSIYQNILPNSKTLRHQRLGQYLLPGCSILPAAVALLALAIRVLKPLLPLPPKWMHNFVTETSEQENGLLPRWKSHGSRYTISLLIIAIAGFILQIMGMLYPKFSQTRLFPITAWVISSGVLSVLANISL